jgi:hypothetical protein
MSAAFFPSSFANMIIDEIQIAVEVIEKPRAVPKLIKLWFRKGLNKIISVPPHKYNGIPVNKIIVVLKIFSSPNWANNKLTSIVSKIIFIRPAKKINGNNCLNK